MREITERKHTEERLRKIDRARKVMAECSRVMVHAGDEIQLLQDMCNIAVDSGGYRMAWAGFAEHDPAKSVRPVAQSGFDAGYLEASRISWGDNERGRGPSGRAIRLGEKYVVRNALTDPGFAPWRENALQRGYRSHIALPLKRDGVAFGVFSLYATEIDAFDAEEIALLEDLAADLAYGIMSLRTRIDHARAEAALKANEELMRATFEQAAVGMAMRDVDPDKPRWLRVNQKLCDILGYTREELLLLTAADITLPAERNSATDYSEALVRGEIASDSRAKRYVRKDGQIITVNHSVSTVRGPDGRPTHLISIIQDITERKRAEEELARTNAELEKFVLVASHDLQEPLRTTANAAMLLEEQHAGKLDGDARELLGFVVSGVMHMRRLIDSLLIFAGIGAKPAVAAATDSRAVLSDVLSHLRAVIGESGAVIDCGPLPIVRIDPAQLDQVFMNLISNAVKFRGATPLRIRVDAHRDKSDWIISVADNGIGINPAYFGKIFEIFERLNARYPGTGVGLAICKKIVEGNNGRIWVDSEEGRGTKFSFTVAAADMEKEAECLTVQSL